jgi:hypothetical protein
MVRGTKKTSIGDAKLFEAGFGACILVGCFLSKIAKRSILLLQVSAPEGYGLFSIPLSQSELGRNELIMSYKGGMSSAPHSLGGITSGRKEARKYVTQP